MSDSKGFLECRFLLNIKYILLAAKTFNLINATIYLISDCKFYQLLKQK